MDAAKLFSEAHALCTGASLERGCGGAGNRRITRRSGRKAATGAIHRAAACAAGAAGVFAPGIDAPRCRRCPASPRVVCALKYLGAAAAPSAGNNPRVRSSCCPCAYSSRTCALQGAIDGVPRDNGAGGSSFGHAAGCTCRVAVVVARCAPAALLSRQRNVDWALSPALLPQADFACNMLHS